MTFPEAAIISAQRYYQFLSDEGKGKIIRRVLKKDIGEDCFVLTLDGKLPYADHVQIQIFNNVYTVNQILPCEYDEQRRTLKVRPQQAYWEILDRTPQKDIFVVSDLRFLVERVGEWYKNYGGKLQLPTKRPQIDSYAFPELENEPSEDQYCAIHGALSSPFAYIWGAPGTGKTRYVLSRCVLMYLQAGKRILLTAPTNNAVEQMLYGVLSVLSEANIPLQTVLRLGLPSTEFRKKYPEVCENISIAKQLSQVSSQIMTVKSQISENKELIELRLRAEQHWEKERILQECEKELIPLLEQLRILVAQEKEEIDRQTVLQGKNILQENQLAESKKLYSRHTERVQKLTSMVEKYGHGPRKLFMPKRYTRYMLDLQSEMKSVEEKEKEIAEQGRILEEIKTEWEYSSGKIEDVRASICNCKKSIDEITGFWAELNSAACSITAESDIKRIADILASGKARLHSVGLKYMRVADVSEQELLERQAALQEELERIEARQKEIESQGSKERMRQCSILAATVDTCLSRVVPDGDFQPEHVFLDEAGYCSLIKGVTLTAYGCPVTFLGDHMQLPPVCEMNDNQFEIDRNSPVSLWAQSALYAGEALTGPPENLYQGYLAHTPASFCQMRKFDLVHTYRFGEALANVLASDVYADGFHGDREHDTNIYFIHAQKVPGAARRTSINECSAIAHYLRMSGERDVGIITPYKAQRERLKEELRGDRELAESVMTVHGSQGREWDTVLFSVVDTNNMWFTDSISPISNGKRVINTAVSRAKRKLILVCDSDYWHTQNRQLIGKLLSVAEEIEVIS